MGNTGILRELCLCAAS